MDIHINNYEQFALDYIEGTLTSEMQSSMDVFLNDNPSIKEEILQVSTFRWPVENLEYPGKHNLLKSRRRILPLWSRIAAGLFLLAAVLWMLQPHDSTTSLSNIPIVESPVENQKMEKEVNLENPIEIHEGNSEKEILASQLKPVKPEKKVEPTQLRNSNINFQESPTSLENQIVAKKEDITTIENIEKKTSLEEEIKSLEQSEPSLAIEANVGSQIIPGLENINQTGFVRMNNERKVEFTDLKSKEIKESPFFPLAFNKPNGKRQIKNSLIPSSFTGIFTK